MSDLEIIDLVAQTWVENGGDSDGFKWCMDSIKNRIIEIEEDNSNIFIIQSQL